MPTTTARVSTDSPERYAKQLCSHLGRRSQADYADGRGRIELAKGVVTLESQPGELVMVAEAGSEEDLAVVADVAGRHLERFGQRNELVVSWDPDPGRPATD
jgi:uncharacterized protein